MVRSAAEEARFQAHLRMRPETVCLPCLFGIHAGCRHQPDGPRYSSPGSEAGKPCQCERAQHKLGDGTCDGQDHSGGMWDGMRRCNRPSKHTLTVRVGDAWSFVTNSGVREATVQVCGIHRNAVERVRANDARRAQESAARQEQRDRDAAAARSAEDWAARLRDEYGVDATAHRTNVVVNAETLYGQLAAADAILRDVLPEEENPLRNRRT